MNQGNSDKPLDLWTIHRQLEEQIRDSSKHAQSATFMRDKAMGANELVKSLIMEGYVISRREEEEDEAPVEQNTNGQQKEDA